MRPNLGQRCTCIWRRLRRLAAICRSCISGCFKCKDPGLGWDVLYVGDTCHPPEAPELQASAVPMATKDECTRRWRHSDTRKPVVIPSDITSILTEGLKGSLNLSVHRSRTVPADPRVASVQDRTVITGFFRNTSRQARANGIA